MIAKKYSQSSHTLKPRLARTFLKTFLDPGQTFGAHYGAIIGLQSIGGPNVIRELIIPNLPVYEVVLKDAVTDEGLRKAEAEKVTGVIIAVLSTIQDESLAHTNGFSDAAAEALGKELAAKVGELIASRIIESGQLPLARAILEKQQ